MHPESFISTQRFYSVLMGVSAMLMFLSLQPEQHFGDSQHPLAAALLLFCGVFSGYRLADLKPRLQLLPLQVQLNKIPVDFILLLSIAVIFLLIARPGWHFLIQFGAAGFIAVWYYTISHFRQHHFDGLRSIYGVKIFHWHWPGPLQQHHYIRVNFQLCIILVSVSSICFL